MGDTAGGTDAASPRALAVLERAVLERAVLERAGETGAVASTLAEAAVGVLADLCGLFGWPVGHLLVTTAPGLLTPTAVWHLSDPERYRVLRQVAQATPVAAGIGLPGRVLVDGAAATGTDVGEAASAAGLTVAAGIPVRCGTEVVAVLHLLGAEALDDGMAEAGATEARLTAAAAAMLATATAAAGELGRVVDRRRAAAAERDRALLLETSNDAFVRLDGDGRVVEWNAQAEVTFGWGRNESVGRSLTEMIVPLRYRAVLDEAFRRALAEGEEPVVSRRELTVVHRSGTEFPIELTLWGSNDSHRRVVDGFLRDVSERRKFEVQLARQALHDRLTALPNRVLMRDRLENALARTLRHRSTVALLVLDVDRFKVVNDSLGHEGGDRLLVQVAERLAKLLRPGDTLARMGGDEFAMLCEDVTGRDEASATAERVVAAMEAPFRVGTTDVAVTVSVGVAVATGAAIVADLLLRDADVAMYRAKQRGRGRFEVFDETMRSQAVDRLSVENDLRRAIRQGQLRLVYQPIVHLDTGQIAGFEALVRWQHPERGLLSPADFIPPAEETGLIVPLGQCVLGEACLQAAAWQRRRGPGEPLRMSVNVSAKELQHPGWGARWPARWPTPAWSPAIWCWSSPRAC